jgi:hypothetical protein
MSDLVSDLNLLSVSQSQKEATINAALNDARPSFDFGIK